MKIRTATTADLPRLLHLWQERRIILNQSDGRFTTPTPADREAWSEHISLRIGAEDAQVWVGVPDNADIAGFISGTVRAGVGVVDDIALDAHTYHPGLGRALWNTLRDEFTTNGIRAIRVIVPRYHAVEQAFWLALRATPWQPPMDDEQWELPAHSMWMTWSSGQ